MTRVYLSLGSNLGDRLALLRAAVQRLRDAADVELVTASPLYESEPWEEEPGRASSEQRWYLNCVLAVDTPLPPRALLERLHGIEDALGRVRPAGTPEARRYASFFVQQDINFGNFCTLLDKPAAPTSPQTESPASTSTPDPKLNPKSAN